MNRWPGIRRSGSTLPQLTLTRHDVRVDRAHVAAYSEVCGFRLRESLPLPYPHVLAFPLHMALMTDAAFPFPAVGTVHLENSITAHRPVSAAERLQLIVRSENLRPHPRGRAFDVVTHVHSAGELVWEETSTFLRRGRPQPGAGAGTKPGSESGTEELPAATAAPFPDVAPSGIEWPLAGDLGRRYAAVSGDHNPIHLHALTARAFGFRRPIAHGMWSKARCLGALEGRLPDAVRVDVAFKRPILLPGRVAFAARTVNDTADSADSATGTRGTGSYAFSLSDPRSGAPHVLGRTFSAG